MTHSTDAEEFREQLRSRKHSLHQLRMRLQSLDRDERFDALLGVFTMNVDSDTYTDQEVAGRLLIDVMPECHQPLETILEVIAQTWNASVEQLPLYLVNVFGRETVIETATALSTNCVGNNRRAEAMRTIAWWVENRRAERRAEMRTNNPMNPSGGSSVF